MDLVCGSAAKRGLNLRLAWAAECGFDLQLARRAAICFDATRSGSKIRFGAAYFDLLFARAAKFCSLRLCLNKTAAQGALFSACVLREFLSNKFAVAGASTYAALNFDFNGFGRRLALLKSKFLPCCER
ncbi:hypothetical protein [uncultured Campylobacter sp.]|uniref:hypothetical protein n=1 Tax=uncultured Campylobacter sp. TaxID=218934 RepID=UPI002628FE25|nr:hypothetical protein [uncultured Campylobacter sp.]